MHSDNRASIYLPAYVPYLVAFLMLIFLVGIEFAYRDPLYEASITAELFMQRDATTAGKIVMKALSVIGEGPLYIAVILLIYNQCSREVSFYFLLVFSLSNWLMNLTKVAYHEGRPYLTDPAVEIYDCEAGYGNPSGHSWFAALFPFLLFLARFHPIDGLEIRKTPAYFICIFLAFAYMGLVGISRIYNGAHAINQVLYGFSWGLYLALVMHYVV